MNDRDELLGRTSEPADDTLPLAERAYRFLQHEIITLKMRPGEVIQEAELREKLGMGRTPVREALLRLAGDKLIVIHPRRGTFVSDMNITDLTAVYEVREALEALAARLAAERVGDKERERLIDIRRRLPTLVEDADLEGLLELDRTLHGLVYRLAKNEFLAATLDHYLNLSIRLARGAVERLGQPWPDWLADAVLGFIPLLQAIEERRPDEAERAARAHAVSAGKQVRQHV